MHRIFGQTVYERLDRAVRQPVGETTIAGFKYWVEGVCVYRRAPDGSVAEVLSDLEAQESLNSYQLAQLRQARGRYQLKII